MSKNLVCILNLAKDLPDLPPIRTPTFEQWTLFYQQLARDNACTKGKHINHISIMQKIDFSIFPSCVIKAAGSLKGRMKVYPYEN